MLQYTSVLMVMRYIRLLCTISYTFYVIRYNQIFNVNFPNTLSHVKHIHTGNFVDNTITCNSWCYILWAQWWVCECPNVDVTQFMFCSFWLCIVFKSGLNAFCSLCRVERFMHIILWKLPIISSNHWKLNKQSSTYPLLLRIRFRYFGTFTIHTSTYSFGCFCTHNVSEHRWKRSWLFPTLLSRSD